MDEGYIGFAEPEKVSLTISEFNALLQDSDWQLLDVYIRNSCRTSLWRNKKTNKTQETIGLGVPGKLLNIENPTKATVLQMLAKVATMAKVPEGDENSQKT